MGYSLLIVALTAASLLPAQKERSLLRAGNEAYEAGDYQQAITRYEESLEENSAYAKAEFNQGNGHYRLGALGEASKHYERAAASAYSKEEKARAYHNVGNSFLEAARHIMQNPPPANDSIQLPDPQQLIRASIEAYKKSLRNVPTDEETRYNLAYAQQLLKEGGGGDQGNDPDQGEQDQQEQDNQDKGDQDQQEDESADDGEQQENEQQSDKPNEMTKEEAEQLLKALDQDEKDLQEKMAKDRMEKGEPVKIDKDW